MKEEEIELYTRAQAAEKLLEKVRAALAHRGLAMAMNTDGSVVIEDAEIEADGSV